MVLQLLQLHFDGLDSVDYIVEFLVPSLAQNFNRTVKIVLGGEQLLVTLLDRFFGKEDVHHFGYGVECAILMQVLVSILV